MLDHSARQLWIPLHLRGDGVQRVEEKVRIELHAQGIQPRFGEASLHSLQPQFGRKVASIVPVRLNGRYNHPVEEPAPEGIVERPESKRLRDSKCIPGANAKRGHDHEIYIVVSRREEQAGEQMRKYAPCNLFA